MIKREVNNSNPYEVFFPVEEQPVFLDTFMSMGRRIPGYKAIVDKETGRVLSVVSNKYKLVQNREAYEMADFIVRAIFNGKILQDFKLFNVLMPKTRSFCRIDLIIPNKFNQLFGNAIESWTPFVRISNSYNRTMVLKYDVGFCRWICKNGMIFGQKGITLSMSHSEINTYSLIDSLIAKAKKQIGPIDSLWELFESTMNKLHEIPLPLSSALPIFCKIFDIKVNKEQLSTIQKKGLFKRANQIVKASKNYFKELGNNAYAMMNVLTDYASFPEWTTSRANFVDSYQRKVGKWIDEFITEYKKPDFNLSHYIGEDYQNTASFLESLVLDK